MPKVNAFNHGEVHQMEGFSEAEAPAAIMHMILMYRRVDVVTATVDPTSVVHFVFCMC